MREPKLEEKAKNNSRIPAFMKIYSTKIVGNNDVYTVLYVFYHEFRNLIRTQKQSELRHLDHRLKKTTYIGTKIKPRR